MLNKFEHPCLCFKPQTHSLGPMAGSCGPKGWVWFKKKPFTILGGFVFGGRRQVGFRHKETRSKPGRLPFLTKSFCQKIMPDYIIFCIGLQHWLHRFFGIWGVGDYERIGMLTRTLQYTLVFEKQIGLILRTLHFPTHHTSLFTSTFATYSYKLHK